MMQAEDRAFWVQVWSALQRIGALLLFLGAHKLLDFAFEKALPVSFNQVVLFIEGIVFCGFTIVYVAMVFDMVAVFIPAIKRRAYGPEMQQGAYPIVRREENQP